ncbi:Alpha/Beta hydrolase protein [Phialemonium atrogriseum]|uniref:Alpha/Beta hydrolase protein n=1 Tax=Phialemonium atrogriseum TaxID=1093897 RepID=A0AAJ0C707_9PEZI|nr:Alpha/Beta hydrolase protein [Phialemonium atrogriseum]KAK1770687.1 Alpha/Beta hydrolase protein [Phialemonium atrogriseum]
MFDTNPNLIQDPQRSSERSSPTPLVLIHDGGGTIFSYYCLGSLGRPLYGIFNPNYHSGRSWAGGLPEMARHYVRLVRTVVPRGPVILGGWSLGGLLSLEMARELAGDPSLRVLGIVMIDSVYPRAPPAWLPSLPVVQHAAKWGENTRPETRAAVTRCFEEAVAMVGRWTPPAWGPESADASQMASMDGRNSHSTSSPAHGPPPVFLLRAKEAVPVLVEGVSRVDLHRQDRLLGWGNYRRDMIVRVTDIPGHHFSIFALENLDAVTEGLIKVCSEVEDWTPR